MSLREAAKNAASALAFTVTNVPTDGARAHWCSYTDGHHDATCSGMIHIQDDLRAAIKATPETSALITVDSLSEAVDAHVMANITTLNPGAVLGDQVDGHTCTDYCGEDIFRRLSPSGT